MSNINQIKKSYIIFIATVVLFVFIFILYVFHQNIRSLTETFSNKKQVQVQFVIARYNETIDWIMNEPFKNMDIICYNKGPRIPDKCVSPNCKIINLQNVGKCDHTYLYHIINNYNNLADVTIFLPGSCMDERKLATTMHVINKAITTKNTALTGTKMEDVRKDLYDFKLDSYITQNPENHSENPEVALTPSPIRPFGKWFDENFGEDLKVKVVCYYSIIAVSKQHITQHSIERYKKLISYLDQSSNPEAGHYMERAWGAIFYPYPDSCIN